MHATAAVGTNCASPCTRRIAHCATALAKPSQARQGTELKHPEHGVAIWNMPPSADVRRTKEPCTCTLETGVRRNRSCNECCGESVVVAAAVAQILLAEHLELAEEVIDTVLRDARGSTGQVALELSDGLGAHLCVEGANHDHAISGHGVAVDRAHDVLRRGRSAMSAAAVHAEGAVVVDEEDRFLALLVDQSDPHDAARRKELLFHVDGHHSVALAGQLPLGPLERNREGMRPLHRGVVRMQATLDHDPRHIVALLHAHHVGRGRGDEGGGAAIVAVPLVIQAPPLKVVR
mmetsp:Transcript_46986/g.125690  ORF Transcript_46986/g.125690 Transcript_46986/m.125690 type:complete len:291 (+) Transcript_46986:158-1030(+)